MLNGFTIRRFKLEMRLYLKLSNNTSAIPYNYQNLLTGCVHKWLGKSNIQHGEISLYSFSWLQNVKAISNGLWITPNSYAFINFYHDEVAKKLVEGILLEPDLFNGASVMDVLIKDTPTFKEKESFVVASPILIKRPRDKDKKHYMFYDKESNLLMTQTLQTKLEKAGLPKENVSVQFDESYGNPKTKLVNYKGIRNKCNLCPIILEGTPEQIAFAWNVGIGNSTGIGFGALK